MIDRAFATARQANRLAFIPYVMAGDPDMETTERLVAALSEAGADAIELGVPYSDPLADGPTIATAAMRSLERGTRLRDVLALVRRVSGHAAPLLLFTYYNPVDRFGIERFADECARSGASGAIVADLALEESDQLRAALERFHLVMPLLVAPSTPRDRAERIAASASGFVYAVARLGVTGASSAPHLEALKEQLRMLREVTRKPLAVGFGIRKTEDIAQISSSADAVIVGSALIDAYAGQNGAAAIARVIEFVSPLIAATARSPEGRHLEPR